jgi:hypothetical protein
MNHPDIQPTPAVPVQPETADNTSLSLTLTERIALTGGAIALACGSFLMVANTIDEMRLPSAEQAAAVYQLSPEEAAAKRAQELDRIEGNFGKFGLTLLGGFGTLGSAALGMRRRRQPDA